MIKSIRGAKMLIGQIQSVIVSDDIPGDICTYTNTRNEAQLTCATNKRSGAVFQ